jgi:alpha-tubulin suppressor-like RCC1 family protein
MTENNDKYAFLKKCQFSNKISEEIKKNIKFIHIFNYNNFLNDKNVILVTNDDEVFCFGSNTYGVLGFGHQKEIKELSINEYLSNKQIIDFKNSLFHTIARTIDGKLYCFGCNEWGLLGIGIEDKEIYSPQLNEYLLNENIIDICCGSSHTLALTSNNGVYAWGWNYFGQIGIKSNRDVFKPIRVNEFNGEKVKAISCGLWHSMALTESGRVFSWGNNAWGQLGIENSEEEHISEFSNSPKLIKLDENIVIEKISCGSEHSLLLSRESDIYGSGRNEFRQLGTNTEKEIQLKPIKLIHSQKFIEISSHCTHFFSAALSKNNLYYVWGNCGENETINEPKETEFQSFQELFAHYFEIAPKFDLIMTGKYTKYWSEISKFGSGSFGTVFKVKHISSDETFAIKKISLKEKKEVKEYIDKEFNTSLIILNHENEFLVKYHEVWYENEFEIINGLREWIENYTIYIQMDLCDKTLSQFSEEIKKDPKLYSNESLTELGFYISSKMFIQILKGVNYLHNKKIIHRDLKPDNILLKSGTIKIGDFGLAKAHDMNIVHTGDKGAVKYAAPEVLSSEPYDTRADIYSLGIILQELFEIDINR